MKNLATGVLTAGVLTVTALGFASSAAAAPVSHNTAAEAISQLQELGYTVQVNVVNGPKSSLLSECSVDSISGRAGTDSNGQPITPAQAGVVHVNINCPSDES
jgi:hypothetical protein